MAEQVLGSIIELLEDPAEPWAGKLVWHHCSSSQRCAGTPGMPDLIVVGPRGGIWAEVKPNPGARLRPEQTTWRYMLLAIGWRHDVWTDYELASGFVRRALEGLL